MKLLNWNFYKIILTSLLIVSIGCKKKKEDETNISIKEMKKVLVVLDKYIEKFKKFKVNMKNKHMKNSKKHRDELQKDFIDTRNNDLKEFRDSCQNYIDTKRKDQPKALSMKGVYKSIKKARSYYGSKDNAILGDSPLTDSDMKEFEDWGKEISTSIWGDYY